MKCALRIFSVKPEPHVRKLESQQAAELVTAIASFEGLADQRQQKLASCDPIPSVLQPDARIDDHDDELLLSPNGPSKLKQEIIDQEDKFLLPDLNIPVENSNSEVIDRVS